MRSGISVSVSAADRRRLEAIVADRNTPQKHVWRVRIVLLTAEGLGTKPFAWRANPDAIITARARGFQALESIH